jgi:AAA+ superfamily predicted ATPase
LLPSQPVELEALARLLQRESTLLPIAIYLDAHEPDAVVKPEDGKQDTTLSLSRFLARTQGIFFLSSCEIRSNPGRATIAFEVKKPTPTEQQTAWTDILKDAAKDSPDLLAGQFNLNVSTIHQVVQRVMAEPSSNGHSLHERLWDACLVSTGPKLDILAKRLEPKATWDDIVLPEEAKDLLYQITDQIKQRSKVYDKWGFRKKLNRGFGINALFSGDSGTGKTMAAEVIANELRLKLYRIDLSGVVSKYIGETEKNLRRLFDAAEDGGAILFFDEADALFGKRSEVKDSHDRYANIEINYLLQRMEAYNGLAILATNMKNALDKAFIRRLRFIVDFPFPGMKERKIIIQKVFPSEVPIGELDYDRLAKLNLTGGSINNIAINSAFMAAQSGGPVTMELILSAARAEFRKMERPVKESDFQWCEPERMAL